MEGVNFELTYPAEATLPYRGPAPFALGQSTLGTDNTTWVFVVADVIVTAGQNVTVNANFHITTAPGTGYTAPVAFAVGDSGWVQKTTSPL
jgi:hypothetical protein